MVAEIQMHDVVALLEDVRVNGCFNNEPVLLRRGQVGTVVMSYDGTAFEVEFADLKGRTYALVTVPAARLMPLKYHLQPAGA